MVSVLRRNIVANLFGSVWVGLMGLVFVPVYIHFMGIEAYGLIGIFATLLGLFALLDMGLSSTLNREMARLSVQEGKAQEMRDLVRTLESLYWVVGLSIAATIVLLSPVIAYHWVKTKDLPPSSVRTAIMLVGLCVAFQWPIGFYSGGLMGLQRQVVLNYINVVVATFRGLGAVLILWLLSPTVEAFFSWQIAVSATQVGLIFFFLWRSLPRAPQAPRFQRRLFRDIWRFAAGMTAITITSTLLMQVDKVVLSRMLSLEMFGYYTLANVVAMSLLRLIAPVFTAVYPQLTGLVQLGAAEQTSRVYHKSAQLVSVFILPAALVAALFSQEVLLLWTRDAQVADHTHVILSFLVMGTAFNGLMSVPYALQLASGWTRLTLVVNIVSVLLLVPLMILSTKGYGAIGGTCVWVAANLAYVFFVPPIMHRRLLRGEACRWYRDDIGRPLLAALVVALIGRGIIRSDWPPWAILLSVGMVGLTTVLASALATNQLDAAAKAKSVLAAVWMRRSRTRSL